MIERTEEFFREEQRFRQPWLWLIVLGTAGTAWYGAAAQLLGRPFGDRPAADGLLLAVWLAVGVGLPLFFRALRLVTVVDAGGVHFRFVPFHLAARVLPPGYVAGYAARRYKPLREYGGWGIRSGRGGDAYNVSGETGVQFVLAGGKKLLIGTQRPAEFVAALDRVFARPGT